MNENDIKLEIDNGLKLNFESDKKIEEVTKKISEIQKNLLYETMAFLGTEWEDEMYQKDVVYNKNTIEQIDIHNHLKEYNKLTFDDVDYKNQVITIKGSNQKYSNYDVDTTVALLGITAFSNDAWLNAVETMGKWYEKNIHTYWGKTRNAAGKLALAFSPPHYDSGIRWLYKCDLFDNEDVTVGDDCTSFISACLLLLAYQTNKDVFQKFKNAKYASGQFTENGSASDLLKSLGFEYKRVNGDAMAQNHQEYEGVVKGDITVVFEGLAPGQHHHGEIYWGVVESIKHKGIFTRLFSKGTNKAAMSWGNVHDGLGMQDGMPASVLPYKYTHVWHYVNSNVGNFGNGIITSLNSNGYDGPDDDARIDLTKIYSSVKGSIRDFLGGGSLKITGDTKHLKLEAKRGAVSMYGNKKGCFGKLYINGSYFCDFAERATNTTRKLHPTGKEFKIVWTPKQGNSHTSRKDWIRKAKMGNPYYLFATISEGYIPQILGTGANGIRIHMGSGPYFSDGCLIVGKHKNGKFSAIDSLRAWKGIYAALLNAESATIKYTQT